MQRFCFGAILLISLFSFSAHGQKNAAKINVLSPFALTASVFYERPVLEHRSIQVGFFYTGLSISDTEFRGFGVTPEFRFYLSETPAPNGFYVAPYVRYQRFRLKVDQIDEYENVKGTYGAFGLGGTVGKQWVFKNNIVLDLFVGPGYNFGKLSASQGDENDFNLNLFSGFTVRGGVTLGYAF